MASSSGKPSTRSSVRSTRIPPRVTKLVEPSRSRVRQPSDPLRGTPKTKPPPRGGRRRSLDTTKPPPERRLRGNRSQCAWRAVSWIRRATTSEPRGRRRGRGEAPRAARGGRGGGGGGGPGG